MKFNRKAVDMGGTYLKAGVYKAKFSKVEATKSQSGKGMIKYVLEANGSTTTGNVVDQGDAIWEKTGRNRTEQDMERILAAINDTGVEIPDEDWTFKTLYLFLNKALPTAYIRVRPQKNNEQYTEVLFISKEQYDSDPSAKNDNSDDPFSSGEELSDEEISDGLPF